MLHLPTTRLRYKNTCRSHLHRRSDDVIPVLHDRGHVLTLLALTCDMHSDVPLLDIHTYDASLLKQQENDPFRLAHTRRNCRQNLVSRDYLEWIRRQLVLPTRCPWAVQCANQRYNHCRTVQDKQFLFHAGGLHHMLDPRNLLGHCNQEMVKRWRRVRKSCRIDF